MPKKKKGLTYPELTLNKILEAKDSVKGSMVGEDSEDELNALIDMIVQDVVSSYSVAMQGARLPSKTIADIGQTVLDYAGNHYFE